MELLFIPFLFLKLEGAIDWPWLIVCLPLIFLPLGIAQVLFYDGESK